MKRMIQPNRSYEDEFWNLYNTPDSKQSRLIEDIVDGLGLMNEVFPDDGEPTATEVEYKALIGTLFGELNDEEVDELLAGYSTEVQIWAKPVGDRDVVIFEDILKDVTQEVCDTVHKLTGKSRLYIKEK